jgi:hypothetical protein
MVIDAMEEYLEQPSAAIRSWLELVKRLPRLEINFLGHVFRSGPVTKKTSGRSEDIVQMRQCLSFETIRFGGGGVVRRQSGHAPLGKIVSHPILGGFETCHICP